MIRDIGADEPLSAHLALEALGERIPLSVIDESIALHGVQEERERKLPAAVTLVLCIAMNLYAHEALPAVFRRLVSGLRWLWPDRQDLSVSKSALSQARYRLGAKPLVSLFHRVCQPLATPGTPGAFLFGLRLMAFEGSMLDLADTAANVAAFGRRRSARGMSSWPQAQLVALCECGTHALCAAGLWPSNHDEEQGVRRLLRMVQTGMLVLSTMGLHSFDLIVATLARGGRTSSIGSPPTSSRRSSRRSPLAPRWCGCGLAMANGIAAGNTSCSASSATPWTIHTGRATSRSSAWSPPCSILPPLRPRNCGQ